MSAALLIAGCGLLVASIMQSATGFGFALIAGPTLYTVVEPLAAVVLVLALGPALGAAVLGLPIGALIVRGVPDAVMRLSVGIAVCAIVVVRLLRRHASARPARVEHRGGAFAAGFIVGILTTSTATSGPPLAIWLTARRMEPAAMLATALAAGVAHSGATEVLATATGITSL